MTTNDPLDPTIPAQPQPSKARKEQAPRAQCSPAPQRVHGNVNNANTVNTRPCERCEIDHPWRECEPPRGQQQEWFYHAEGSNRFHVYFGSVVVGGVIVGTERQAKAICDAHNAALAAEREHRKLVDKVLDNRCLQLRKMEEVLATERQRRLMAADEIERLAKQLLSAQAAIEKLAELIIELDGGKLSFDHAKVLHGIRNDVDLSALHNHDAEVREPLVKALEQLSKLCTPPVDERDRWHWTGKIFCDAVKEICDDALAKVEEQ